MRAPNPSALMLTAFLLALPACDTLFGPGESVDTSMLEGLPRALSADELETVRAGNSFAFDLLRETVARDTARNVFLSPLSASMALGMTTNGARGETQEGMKRALGFGEMEMEAINAGYRDLIDLLLGLDRGVDMRIANSIWARDGIPFHEEFFQTGRDYFDAEVATLDFSAPAAAATINAWVEEGTGGRIEEIVDDPIPSNVVMYLINAVYFKGDWRHPFDADRTGEAPFFLAAGGEKTVRMMHRVGPAFHHRRADGTQIAELLYGRGAFAMTLVLPGPGTDVDTLVGELDAERWQEWTDALHEGELSVSLPRFALEYETVMNEPLIELGMGLAFGTLPGTDFTGMSPIGEGLQISEVKQKTFLEVNEEGTEAAGATSVGIIEVSGPPSFVVDRPFLVAIRERFSGALLFLGRIGEPQSD